MKSRNNISKMVISYSIMTLCLSAVLGTAAAVRCPISQGPEDQRNNEEHKTGEVVSGGRAHPLQVADVRVDNGFKFVYTDDFTSRDGDTEDTSWTGSWQRHMPHDRIRLR